MKPRIIILAAGQGTRLGSVTDHQPKCLVDLGGTSILAHQLDNCEAAELDEAVVVTGSFASDVDDEIDRWRTSAPRRLAVRSLYNPFFDVANNMISLWAARGEMDRDFITINGDNVFDWRILEALVRHEGGPITVTIDTKEGYDEDDMKIVLRDGRIRAMNKEIPLAEANGESIGIMRFTGAGRALLSEELEAMARLETYAREWYVQAIERIAIRGDHVDVMPVGAFRWAEVDFPEDLDVARARFAELAGVVRHA
ncbi:MAG: phosphocholine cytidylyltransferase family protein [Longimicrobiales bacterium]|nr:phosphocholine cytidylyltransferase family protein [Longimicrobiales bacterium]